MNAFLSSYILGAAFYLFILIAFVHRPALRVWLVWTACAIGIVVAVDLFRSTAQLALLRYTLFATPGMYVVIASAIEQRRWRWVLPAAMVLLAFLSLPSAYVPHWKTDFQSPIQIVSRRMQPTDALIISGPEPIPDGVIFASFQHYLPAMPVTNAILTTAPDGPTLARLQQSPHVWLIRLPGSQLTSIPGYQMKLLPIPSFAGLFFGERQVDSQPRVP